MMRKKKAILNKKLLIGCILLYLFFIIQPVFSEEREIERIITKPMGHNVTIYKVPPQPIIAEDLQELIDSSPSTTEIRIIVNLYKNFENLQDLIYNATKDLPQRNESAEITDPRLNAVLKIYSEVNQPVINNFLQDISNFSNTIVIHESTLGTIPYVVLSTQLYLIHEIAKLENVANIFPDRPFVAEELVDEKISNNSSMNESVSTNKQADSVSKGWLQRTLAKVQTLLNKILRIFR